MKSTLSMCFLFVLVGIPGVLVAAESTNAPPKGIHTVKAGAFKVEVKLSGAFGPSQSTPIKLRPKTWTDLTVKSVVAHGAEVGEGTVLIEFEMEKLDRRITDSKRALEAARLDLALANAEHQFAVKSAELDRNSAQLAFKRLGEDLKHFQEHVKEFNVKSTHQSYASYSNSLAYAEEELKQLKKMYDADDLTEETEEIIIQRALNTVNRARFSLERAELTRLASLKFGMPREIKDRETAQERSQISKERLKATFETSTQRRELSIQQKRVDFDKAGKAHVKLEADRKLLDVKAPANGVVYYGEFVNGLWTGRKHLAAKLRPSGKVMPNETFMTVVSPRPLIISGSVGEKDLRQLNLGTRGWATPTAAPEQRIPVTVTAISRVPSAPGKFAITLAASLGVAHGYLAPGMGCAVKLEMYSKAKALTVPSAALHYGPDQKPYVKVVAGETTENKAVQLGRTANGKTEITGGLKAGDQVKVN
ncbi:MAG: hypothetical protein ACKJR1_06840 [Limisphaerales bacterium]